MIVTHPIEKNTPTQADLMFALAILLTSTKEEVVELRPITKTDIDDPSTWVIDTGRKYNPELKNFDCKARIENSVKSLDCTSFLVAKELNLDLSLIPYLNYLNFSVQESRESLLSKFDIDVPYEHIISPFEKWFQRQMWRKSTLSTGFITTLRHLGSSINHEIHKKEESLSEFKAAFIETIGKRKVIFVQNTMSLQKAREIIDADYVVTTFTGARGRSGHSIIKMNTAQQWKWIPIGEQEQLSMEQNTEKISILDKSETDIRGLIARL